MVRVAILEEIRLSNFRNYSSASIQLGPGIFLVEGPNGSGKTNLVEAMYLLGNGRSWRPGGHSVLIGPAGTTAMVAGTLRCSDKERKETSVPHTLAVHIDSRVAVKLDGRVTNSSYLSKVFPVVAFTPEDSSLIKEGGERRREWLDSLGRAILPGYAGVRRRYERAHRQRSALLRIAKESGSQALGREADAWNSEFAISAAELLIKRLEVYKRLRPYLGAGLDQVGFHNTHVIRYKAMLEESVVVDSWEAAVAGDWRTVAEEYMQAIKHRARDEFLRGICLVGPQRDDIYIEISGMSSRDGISQGQQRLLAIALRLAEARLIRDSRGTKPVFLLDDVFSELDEERQLQLWESLDFEQAFITSAMVGLAGPPTRDIPIRRLVLSDGEVLAVGEEYRGEQSRGSVRNAAMGTSLSEGVPSFADLEGSEH